MTPEKTEKLVYNYPKIFTMMTNLGDPPHFPISLFSFECSDGWFNIIDQFCRQAQWHIDQKIERNQRNKEYIDMVSAARAGDFTKFNNYFDWCLDKSEQLENYRKEVLEEEILDWRKAEDEIPQIIATQVKEKFGTLRFYYDGGDDFIHGLSTMAESMSAVTCEVCGNPGKTIGGGWVRTLCRTHAEEEHKEWIEDDEVLEDNDE